MSGDAMRGRGLAMVAVAALAGFGAVYVMSGRPDNAPSAPDAAKPIEPGESTAGSAANAGKMAAFVKKRPPEAVADVTFQDGAGKPVSLSSFKGRTVLLNLWATWCAPCRKEMPGLDRLQQALGSDKFEVVALSLDRAGAEASQKFLSDVKATSLKLYIDPTAKQGTALKLLGMPTTILIDADGREVGRLAGEAEWDSDDAKKLIEAAIK